MNYRPRAYYNDIKIDQTWRTAQIQEDNVCHEFQSARKMLIIQIPLLEFANM